MLRLLDRHRRAAPAPTSPFRRENLRLAIVLLYTTGLRLGELVRLTLGDYDPHERTLLIRDSKFHKSRLVPLSIDGAREIDQYLAVRRSRQIAISPESPLLWHHTRRGTAYTGTGLSKRDPAPPARRCKSALRQGAYRESMIFATHLRSKHCCDGTAAGADVQAKLPLLATYMGHVSIASTEYYLKFVEPLGVSASERFARHCGALVTAMPASAGGVR